LQRDGKECGTAHRPKERCLQRNGLVGDSAYRLASKAPTPGTRPEA
jgi:hypothetical protein